MAFGSAPRPAFLRGRSRPAAPTGSGSFPKESAPAVPVFSDPLAPVRDLLKLELEALIRLAGASDRARAQHLQDLVTRLEPLNLSELIPLLADLKAAKQILDLRDRTVTTLTTLIGTDPAGASPIGHNPTALPPETPKRSFWKR
jgi:hypothetical protein